MCKLSISFARKTHNIVSLPIILTFWYLKILTLCKEKKKVIKRQIKMKKNVEKQLHVLVSKMN